LLMGWKTEKIRDVDHPKPAKMGARTTSINC